MEKSFIKIYWCPIQLFLRAKNKGWNANGASSAWRQWWESRLCIMLTSTTSSTILKKAGRMSLLKHLKSLRNWLFLTEGGLSLGLHTRQCKESMGYKSFGGVFSFYRTAIIGFTYEGCESETISNLSPLAFLELIKFSTPLIRGNRFNISDERRDTPSLYGFQEGCIVLIRVPSKSNSINILIHYCILIFFTMPNYRTITAQLLFL